jgi:hypothetical protein
MPPLARLSVRTGAKYPRRAEPGLVLLSEHRAELSLTPIPLDLGVRGSHGAFRFAASCGPRLSLVPLEPEMRDLALAILVGFPFGFLAGYLWRDHISRARRAKFLAKRESRRQATHA